MGEKFKNILKELQSGYSIFEYATIIFFVAATFFYFLGIDVNWNLIMMAGFVILVVDFVQLRKKNQKLKKTVGHMSKKDRNKLIKIEQELLRKKK